MPLFGNHVFIFSVPTRSRIWFPLWYVNSSPHGHAWTSKTHSNTLPSHLYLSIPSGIFLSSFQAKTLYESLVALMHATFIVHVMRIRFKASLCVTFGRKSGTENRGFILIYFSFTFTLQFLQKLIHIRPHITDTIYKTHPLTRSFILFQPRRLDYPS